MPKSWLTARIQANNERPSSIPPGSRVHTNSNGHRSVSTPPKFGSALPASSAEEQAPHLDLVPHLQRSSASVVKTRSGSVLSRGFILKTDFYPTGRALDLDINVHGAPNFRASRQGDLNVFGVAQPRTQGLRAILSVLRCRPGTPDPSHVVWFSTREEPLVYISGRPFVLRDAADPRNNLPISDRAENLEQIEDRLKNDILQEASRFGGLILTHNEMGSDSGEGAMLPTWTAVDTNNVKTSKQLWGQLKTDGWNVDYHRIPISPDRPIEDNYLDAYLRVIKETDPLRSALVFSCGMGAVRTTFAMVAASIIRRKQLVSRGLVDPYALKGPNTPSGPGAGIGTPPIDSVVQSLEQAIAQQELSKSLLRLTYLIQRTLVDQNSQSAIELLMAQPTLLENLRKAYVGNYSVILSLLGCLDHGLQIKRLVDRVIDSTDHVTNMREDILLHRIKYSLTTMDETQGEALLNKALKSLEKYFFIMAFAGYVEEVNDFSQTFSEWLLTRTEISNQIAFLRKTHGSRLNAFAPVNDLSSLSRTRSEGRAMVSGKRNDVSISGGQILGDEYSNHVVKNRSGIILRESTLLKSDQWLQQSKHVEHGIRGAINFRQISDTMIFALGQPTLEAIDQVVARIKEVHPNTDRVLWIALREEPIVYVNGEPYCLRREGFSLRNMKDYGGISASRLEILEDRLREDVVAELNTFGGQLLLHSENADGTVIPIWEEVQPDDVLALKDAMRSRTTSNGVELVYDRIPITAERAPDFADLTELIEVMLRLSPHTPIVVNCQLGRGRSTMVSIILLLLRRWLEEHKARNSLGAGTRQKYQRTLSAPSMPPMELQTPVEPKKRRHSYQVINNLLRVMRKGPAVKSIVDDAIDECAEVYDLREAIEESRTLAEQATDEKVRRAHVQKGLHNLRRYFELLVFQSYLQSIEPDTMESFETIETYVKNRPVIRTFEKEFLHADLNTLTPLQHRDTVNGVALPDEVNQVVVSRSGSILSASTILKSDFFSNLQKMTLPERIEGSPNFRRLDLVLPFGSTPTSDDVPKKKVCGSGMPTVDGLRRALERVDAGPNGSNSVFWTSLREEPVIYVAGRPHVLRLVDKPLENVEATGVTTAVVESMEKQFKKDILQELRAGEGRILLHDEVEERPGVFSIIPLWENVTEDAILTPREAFEQVIQEGYKLDYARIAITDEQAPLPDALAQLLDRMRTGLAVAGDFVFNCQMGRGRTTTGMVAACLASSTVDWDANRSNEILADGENVQDPYDSIDGPSEEDAYRQGEYKTILQLVGVLSHGKVAKRLADEAIDQMQDVQNLRKAIYDYKVKVDACEKGTAKEQKLRTLAVNYLYRYGTLIVFANFLIQTKEMNLDVTFPDWLGQHREIANLLKRRALD